jgi:translation initiation factor 2 gamma subunit (eIF-2gamma)
MIKRNVAIMSVLSLAVFAAAVSASTNAFVVPVSAQSSLDLQSIISSIQDKLQGATGSTGSTDQIGSIINQLKSLENNCTPGAETIQGIITQLKSLTVGSLSVDQVQTLIQGIISQLQSLATTCASSSGTSGTTGIGGLSSLG